VDSPETDEITSLLSVFSIAASLSVNDAAWSTFVQTCGKARGEALTAVGTVVLPSTDEDCLAIARRYIVQLLLSIFCF